MQFSQEPLFLKSLFGGGWNKVVGHTAGNFIKKRLQHRCFPVNIAKFVVTPVLKNSCVWLLLKIIIQKDFLEKLLVTVIIIWQIWTVKSQDWRNWPLTSSYLQCWWLCAFSGRRWVAQCNWLNGNIYEWMATRLKSMLNYSKIAFRFAVQFCFFLFPESLKFCFIFSF